ncbi:MAG: response regulator transcription factor [Sphingobacteriales bacterium]|nr:MAG: response regulator transcription factor [Sphingobacteriales bacterium]
MKQRYAVTLVSPSSSNSPITIARYLLHQDDHTVQEIIAPEPEDLPPARDVKCNSLFILLPSPLAYNVFTTLMQRYHEPRILVVGRGKEPYDYLPYLQYKANGYIQEERILFDMPGAVTDIMSRGVFSGTFNIKGFSINARLPESDALDVFIKSLTRRQQEVFHYLRLCPDMSHSEIAEKMYTTRATVSRHMFDIRRQAGVKTHAALLQYVAGLYER